MKKKVKISTQEKSAQKSWLKKQKDIQGTLDLKSGLEVISPLPQKIEGWIGGVGLVLVVGFGGWIMINQTILVLAKASKNEKVSAEVSVVNEKIQYWEGVIKSQPTYVPAFSRLVVLNWQLGHHQEAQKYLDRIKTIDPNWVDLQQLEKLFE